MKSSEGLIPLLHHAATMKKSILFLEELKHYKSKNLFSGVQFRGITKDWQINSKCSKKGFCCYLGMWEQQKPPNN